MKQILILIFLITIITSCSNKVTAPLTSVMNTEPLHHKWKVTEMHGSHEALPNIYLDLRDILKTHGSAGCDSVVFTPKYSYNNRVEFMYISVPLPMCKGTTLTDQQFLKNLNDVHFFSVAQNQLSLFDKSRTKLFEAVYHSDDEQGSLLRKWEIVKMMNADGERLSKARPYLDFTDLNQSTAYVGCNRFHFPVTLTGKHDIFISNAASTKKYCEGDVNDEVLSKIFPLVKMYQVVGNTLKLFDKDNLLLIEAISPLE